MPQLQNEVIDEIFSALRDIFFDVENLKIVADETPAGILKPFVVFAYSASSPTLAKLAVDRLAWNCSEDVFEEIIEDLPKEVWLYVAKVLKSRNELYPEDFYFAED
jgi:hypothetical protein